MFERGRFSVPDPAMAAIAHVGTVTATVAAGLSKSRERSGPSPMLGTDPHAIAARAAVVLLHGLGLTFKEAQAIARRPIPRVDV